jgi:hypothetical protein
VFVSEQVPSPQEARDALAEASSQATRVRESDHQFRWILVGIATAYLLVGAVVSASPSHRGGNFAALAFLAIMLGGLVGGIVLISRIRAYSRVGVLWFAGACAAFNIWNAIVCGGSILTGWWGPNQPSYHFGVSAAVCVIPLFVAAWLIGRR